MLYISLHSHKQCDEASSCIPYRIVRIFCKEYLLPIVFFILLLHWPLPAANKKKKANEKKIYRRKAAEIRFIRNINQYNFLELIIIMREVKNKKIIILFN